ncbi:HAO1 [Branchiostoma lanceolatum]|uniref:(S)-2-hydroxy-acid oxidase n=1 Tax=Branchiostoma lanceolatum TaxID=7740 RepID=A0A8J9Z530_BRALA|nr:HAO1 [Branchiostoma lanceolatum]
MSENVHPMATSVAEFEKAANEKLPEFVREYFGRPGEGGQTYRDNCEAFKRYRLIPRYLRDVYIRDTSVTVLGSKLDFPVAIAPTAVHKLAHPDAEAATAKGAASINTAMVLSSLSLLMMYVSLFHPPGAASMNTAMVLSSSSLLMMYVSLFHPPGAASINTAMVLSSLSLLMMRGLHEGPELLVALLMMYVSLFHPPGAASINTAMVLSSLSLLMMYVSLFHPPGAASMNTAMVLSSSSLLMMYVSLFHPPGAASMSTAMVLSSSSLLMMYVSLFHPPGAASMNTAMVLSSCAASMNTAMVLSSSSLLMMRSLNEHSDGPELLVALLMMYASLFHPPGAASMNTAMVLSSSSLLMMCVSLFHPPGAASMNTAMVLSSWSHCSLEQVAAAAPRGVRWFYLLFYRDRGRMKRLLERAERAGYTAIVLTVDQPLFNFDRIINMRRTEPLPLQVSFPNIWLDDDAHGQPGSAEHLAYLKKIVKEAATWEDVEWVKNNTRLPVVLKGILSAEDARTAVDLGVSGIYVSNHGGRQQDGLPATIDVLPDIVRAVGGEAEVYLDGGVRTGTDVLKALALGARCVFIGRPALWGLACNGAEGVQQVLQILKDELSLAMVRAGCAKISDIQPSLVVHESFYLYRQLFNHAGNVNNKIVKSKY